MVYLCFEVENNVFNKEQEIEIIYKYSLSMPSAKDKE